MAQDRPNQEDFLQARKFAQCEKKKIESGRLEPVVVPGNRPYRVFNGMNIAPEVDVACIKCTTCADHCPTGAISRSNPMETDALLCINCIRCIENCPGGFRDLPSKVKEMLLQRLSPLVKVSRRNEIFL